MTKQICSGRLLAQSTDSTNVGTTRDRSIPQMPPTEARNRTGHMMRRTQLDGFRTWTAPVLLIGKIILVDMVGRNTLVEMAGRRTS